MAAVPQGSNLANWISAISQLLFLIFFILIFLGANQRFQVYMWKGDIRQKLILIERMAAETREKTKEFIIKNKGRNVDEFLKKVFDFFVISPVDIEPTDIIKRMDSLFNARRSRFKGLLKDVMPETDEVIRSRAESATEISGALHYLVKVIKHILLLEEKTKNWILVMQLQLLMPTLLNIAEALRRAADYFLKGVPIGDGAGPLVARDLAGDNAIWEEIVEDTVVTKTQIEDRVAYIIKAKGPGSNVGRPGLAAEVLIKKLIEENKKPSLMITVDAALKLESEETGEIAEGVGAAIGDPGPEKIRFERLSSTYEIPLRAVVIKMSEEEAITGMSKKIYDATREAIKVIKRIIKETTRPGDIVVIAGIGNSLGIL
jgi:hypothetical protein